MNITIFEKESRIGGRTLTINPFGDASKPVELGGSIFVQSNQIMYSAVREFGLSIAVPDPAVDPTMGIWDGDSFVYTIDQRNPSWWNTLKIVWKYGPNAVQRTTDMVTAIIGSFLRIYQTPLFPFRSLTQVVNDLDLVSVTGITGQQLLDANNVSCCLVQRIRSAADNLPPDQPCLWAAPCAREHPGQLCRQHCQPPWLHHDSKLDEYRQ